MDDCSAVAEALHNELLDLTLYTTNNLFTGSSLFPLSPENYPILFAFSFCSYILYP